MYDPGIFLRGRIEDPLIDRPAGTSDVPAGAVDRGEGASGPSVRPDEATAHESLFQSERGNVPPRFPGRPFPSWYDLLAVIGAMLAISVVVSLVTALLGKSGIVPSSALVFVSYVLQMGLSIVFVAVQRRMHGSPGRVCRMSRRGADAFLILWGFLLVFAVSFLLEPLLALFPDRWMEWIERGIGNGGWAVTTAVVAAPILEEVLFRGMLLDEIRVRWGAVRAVVLSAALFGFIHLIPPQAINAFFVGLVLGYIYVRTSSLLPVIAIHALNNALAYLQMQWLGEFTVRDLLGSDRLYWSLYALVGAICIGVGTIVVRRLRALDGPADPPAAE